MSPLDIFATYLYGLKPVVMVTAILMALSGIDDLFIDIVYWTRRAWRSFAIYGNHDRLDYKELYGPAEKALAIMVPAWHEAGVIGNMVQLAATTLDYENYHVFIGTYPNDPETQGDVDEVCARFRNVHKIVCARPGPTSKADCLNNVLEAILQYEKRAALSFEGFVLHDAEDVVSPMELRLFNYLVERKDLIQIPVYPFERRWTSFTGLHYLDEFAEVHGKDVPVREALAGQVPGAGVGTCFSRRAVFALLAGGDGIAFDVQSLTEDYDVGLRLKERGLTEIFVRFPVLGDDASWFRRGRPFGQRRRSSSVICVREYFPETARAAIRQKSRWIVGIVYQGYKAHKWTNSWMLNYFLWRDRKGALNNFVSFAATLILLQLLAIAVVTQAWPQAPRFLSIFEGGVWFTALLWANFALMGNRMLQRVIFVTGYYGLAQGLMSIPRLFWANYINFMANLRAIGQIIESGDPRRVAWDKTSHAFPSAGANRAHRPLGAILMQCGVLNEVQLEGALLKKSDGLRLGSALVHAGIATPAQVAAAIAEQAGVPHEYVEASRLANTVIAQLPSNLALRYAVLPLRSEGTTLVLASESPIDPVSLSALSRKLNRGVGYVIAHKGQVTVGLRRWYARRPDDPRRTIEDVVQMGLLPARRANVLWDMFVARQVLLAEVLMCLGDVDSEAFVSVLPSYERSSDMIGDFLVRVGMIDRQILCKALELQATLQPSLPMLLRDDGVEVREPPQSLPAFG